MSLSSDTQMVLFGLYATGAGSALALAPSTLLSLLSPITGLLEGVSGLPALVSGPGTAPAGLLASAIGVYYLLAVQSGDEKFKASRLTPVASFTTNLAQRNTIVGRYLFGINCLLACKFTDHGTSFLVILGVTDILAATFMGLTIGFTASSSSKRE